MIIVYYDYVQTVIVSEYLWQYSRRAVSILHWLRRSLRRHRHTVTESSRSLVYSGMSRSMRSTHHPHCA